MVPPGVASRIVV